MMDINGPAAVPPPEASQPGGQTNAEGSEELSAEQQAELFGQLLLTGTLTSTMMLSSQIRAVTSDSEGTVEG